MIPSIVSPCADTSKNSVAPDKSAAIEQVKTRGKRRLAPCFDQVMVNHPIATRLDAILSKHDWSKNRYIAKLRETGATLVRKRHQDGAAKVKVIPPRRASIRVERCETMTHLARAVFYRTCYDPDAPFLFECKASVPELAKMIGQLHTYQPGYDGDNGQYRHGRKSYDPVLGALEDWAAAGLILLVTEYDKQAMQYKASRIFLRPQFFKSFGLSMKATKSMLHSAKKWMIKHDLVEDARKARQAETLRQTDNERIAGLDRPSLRNLLARLKREFTGENKRTKQIMDANHRLKKALKQTRKDTQPLSDLELKLRQLCARIAPIHVINARKTIKGTQPSLTGSAADEALYKILTTFT